MRLGRSSVAAQGLNQGLIIESLIGRLVGVMRLLTLLIRNEYEIERTRDLRMSFEKTGAPRIN